MRKFYRFFVFCLFVTGWFALFNCQKKSEVVQADASEGSQQEGETSNFPLTIEHKFGTTVIERKPQRIASLDFEGADNLLALGVQPVVIRYWYGDYLRRVWPWAEPLLQTEPSVLENGDLNYEQIAAENPDVIIALWSGIDEEAYTKLSSIAPVVAVPEGVEDYSLPWDKRAIRTGLAIGEEAKAREMVQGIEQKLEGIRQAYPQWQGKTFGYVQFWQNLPGAYTSLSPRIQFFQKMGFRTLPAIDELAKKQGGNKYYVNLSEEKLNLIDGDLIVWVTSNDKENWEGIKGLKARKFLKAHQEGREIFVNALIAGAFAHSSLLSIPYALDAMVELIEEVIL